MKTILLMLSLLSHMAIASATGGSTVAYEEGLASLNYHDMKGENFGDKAWRALLANDPVGGTHATMWRLLPGFDSGIHKHTATYHSVVVEGVIENSYPGETKPVRLKKGGYFTVLGGAQHITKCVSKSPCVFLGVMDKPFDFIPKDTK